MVSFSIIVPVYKVEDYLRECVESLLAQSYQNVEIILVDDGSPDNCPQICDEYAAKDQRVKVIHKTNGGLSDSRNAGIKAATGDYVAFVDSDDYWEGDHLSAIAAVLDNDKSIDTVILNNRLYFDDTGKFFSKPILEDVGITENPGETLRNLIEKYRQGSSAWLRIVRRSLLVENEIYFEKGLLGEDSDWFVHLSLHVKKYFQYKPYVYIYRQNRKGSITATIKRKNITDQFHIIDKWSAKLDDKTLDPELKSALLGFLSYLLSVVVYLVSKLPDEDRAAMVAEIKKRKQLFKYAINPKSKQTALLCKFLGVNTTSELFHKLYAWRKKRRATS